MAWKGWGIANDRVIDKSVDRPYSWWATPDGKKTKKAVKNQRKKIDHQARRKGWMWN